MGDALLQKTYTVDVLTKKRVSNNGIVPHYYVENNHEAIIPRQLFMQFQEELLRRAHLKTENGNTKEDTPWMFDSNDLDEYGNYDPYRDPEIREPLEGAQKMADMGCATHGNGVGCHCVGASEGASTIEEALRRQIKAYMDSPEHRALLLNWAVKK